MKPEFKIEGDKLIVKAGLETGVDQDKDGIKSIEVKGQVEVILDGSEVVDELVKSSSFVEKIKAKIGL